MHDISRPGGIFEKLVYSLTAAQLTFAVSRIWGGASHEASIQAAEFMLCAWVVSMVALVAMEWRAGKPTRRRPGDTGEFERYRGPRSPGDS